MQLYADEAIASEYPMVTKFLGEPAVDCGGVSCDMLSGILAASLHEAVWWQLTTTSIEQHSSSTDLKVIGCICRMVTYARNLRQPALMGMLLGPGAEVGGKVYLEAFLD